MRTRWMIAALALAVGGMGEASADDALRAAVAQDYQRNLAPLFDHFHRNPELGFREVNTSKRLARELRALGITVTEGVGGTGVVGVVRNGEGPVVLLRADMDGLPIEERSGLPNMSRARQVDVDGVEKPVMHACGHDVHMTALVGAARQLMARKDQWRGTLVFIGQPAEEKLGGAKAMMEDGLYTRFPKPDYALAFHVSAQSEAGKFGVPLGAAYSSSDSVDIVVRGVGAHGASPHKGVDPVLIASDIVVTLQSLVSRSLDPLKPGVVTVGTIRGGSARNIIPEEVKLELTVRADDLQSRDLLLAGIKRVADGVARSYGVPEDRLPQIVASVQSTPPTVNDAATAERVRAAFLQAFGPSAFSTRAREGMGAEDFAYFVQPQLGVKGVYFSVGGTPEAQLATAASHHSPLFKITPEPSVRAGVEGMTVAAMTLLAKP